MSSFFAYLYRMRYIERWGLMKNSTPENLAEHTLDTALIAYALAAIGRDLLHLTDAPDPDICATAALFHDVPEILTGDLPTPVKYFNPEIANAYKAVEQNAQDKLLGMVPTALRERIGERMCPPDKSVREIVHWADKLSAYIKCIEEIKSGNREFARAEAQIREALDGCEREDVAQFRQKFLPAYELTLDELE